MVSPRVIGSPEHFEDDRARAKAARTYDRCFYPAGVANQLVAVMSSPSRSEGLRVVDLRDAGRPRELARIALPGEAWDVVVVDGFAFVAAGSAGLVVVDLAGLP